MFTIRNERLQVLLRSRTRAGGSVWALPGGYVGVDEDLDRSAQRTLAQQTGVRDVYLEQLYTFGRPDRHPQARVFTVAYYALVPFDRVDVMDDAPVGIAWHDLRQLPDLYLDHAEIVEQAHRRLVAKLAYSTIAFQFMPEVFTLSELQSVCETILGEPLDKRNFRKRVLALNCVDDTGQKRRNGSHRPARLFRYNCPGEIKYIK